MRVDGVVELGVYLLLIIKFVVGVKVDVDVLFGDELVKGLEKEEEVVEE